jgi:glutamine synthetase adenylyltransferase
MFQVIEPAARGLAAATFLSAIVLASPLRAATIDQAQVAQANTTATAPADQAAKPSHADRVEARIKKLHDELKITPAQEQQWNAVAQTMRDNAQAMQGVIQQRRQNAGTMTAVDDLRSYQTITETHAQGLQKLVPAFQALYDTMSDEQKKNADAIFSHQNHRHHHAHRQAPPADKG